MGLLWITMIFLLGKEAWEIKTFFYTPVVCYVRKLTTKKSDSMANMGKLSCFFFSSCCLYKGLWFHFLLFFLLNIHMSNIWLFCHSAIFTYLSFVPLQPSGWWRTLGHCQWRTQWSVWRRCWQPISARTCRSASRLLPSTMNNSPQTPSLNSSSPSRALKVSVQRHVCKIVSGYHGL